MRSILRNILTFVILVPLLSCSEKITDNPQGNKPPKTYLWLFPDSTIGVGISRQQLRWWGEDPDGVIKGYLFAFSITANRIDRVPSPDTLRYVWTTKNDTLIQFPLDTLFRLFAVYVRAVDNSFRNIPTQSIVRLSPAPYWDKNANGVFDGDDAALTDLPGAVDPVGAVQTFPIRNTPPTIAFALNPNDPTLALKQPDTTFTSATFAWKGSDFDGDNTLASYRIALNDTSDPTRWVTIPIRDTIVTLFVPRARSDTAGASVEADIYGGRFLGRQFLGRIRGLRLDALNVLYVQVKDVAGEFSPAIRMPVAANHWFVRRPRGKLLIIKDDVNYGVFAETTYVNALAQVPGGEFATVDRIDIGRGLTADEKANGRFGPMVPPFVDPALINTFLLYDYVFWYTEQVPSLGVAQLSLFTYMQNGGKVLFSTTFQNVIDPRGALRDFAPIDSISGVDLSPTRPPVPPPVAGDTRLYGSYMVFADSSSPADIYPNLQLTGTLTTIHSVFMRPLYRRSDARYIYRLQPSHLNRYIGSPNVGVVDGQRSIVFIGLPLHILKNTTQGSGLVSFFTRTLTQSFDPFRKVDRSRF